MALSVVCFVPSKLRNSLSLARPCPRPRFSSSESSFSSSSCCQKTRRESNETPKEYPPIFLRKRLLGLFIVAVILSSPIPTISTVMAEGLDLERYTDLKSGFTLLRPFSWVKEPNKTANNVGVVVNPVRLTNLEEFGTPQLVADKLIQAEKRKVFDSLCSVNILNRKD